MGYPDDRTPRARLPDRDRTARRLTRRGAPDATGPAAPLRDRERLPAGRQVEPLPSDAACGSEAAVGSSLTTASSDGP